MHEVMRFQFNGRPFEFTKLDGEWWGNAAEAAEALNLSDRRKLLNLFKRHEDEFTDAETCVLDLRTQVGQARRTRLFSVDGLRLLAMFARTPKAKEFRRWLLGIARQLHAGARLVTADQLEQFATRIRSETSQEIGFLRDLVRQGHSREIALAGLARIEASNAARYLSAIAHSPEVRAAIQEARDAASGQNRLPFDFGVERTDGAGNGNGNGGAS